MSMDYTFLPEHMREGTQAYFEQHREPGGFLWLILAGQWAEAACHADPVNRAFGALRWKDWLEAQAPAEAWGSPAKVAAWLAART